MRTSTIGVWVSIALCGICLGLWVTSDDMLAQEQAAKPAPRSVDLDFQLMSQERVAGNFYRTAVPGGWLVVLEGIGPSAAGGAGSSMVFIPDEGHKWDGKSLPLSR